MAGPPWEPIYRLLRMQERKPWNKGIMAGFGWSILEWTFDAIRLETPWRFLNFVNSARFK